MMKTKGKTIAYILHSIAAAVLLLTAQISLAGSATWLLSPQDSAWENANNWTPGGPPNGPSDIATFAHSSQTDVDISTSEEVNSIVFTSNSDSFTLNISPHGGFGGELIISGTGVINNNSVLKSFVVRETGQMIFNNTSTAASDQMRIANGSGFFLDLLAGQFSTAHRVPATHPSSTAVLASHMKAAARQFSMAHQLRPTLPSITREPVPSPSLVAV